MSHQLTFNKETFYVVILGGNKQDKSVKETQMTIKWYKTTRHTNDVHMTLKRQNDYKETENNYKETKQL